MWVFWFRIGIVACATAYMVAAQRARMEERWREAYWYLLWGAILLGAAHP